MRVWGCDEIYDDEGGARDWGYTGRMDWSAHIAAEIRIVEEQTDVQGHALTVGVYSQGHHQVETRHS